MSEQTRWRLRAFPGRAGLDVKLAVDTKAPAVLEVIERAARENGIELDRLPDEDDEA